MDDVQAPEHFSGYAEEVLGPVWLMVPVEPTEAMCAAFTDTALKGSVHGAGGWHGYAREQWDAMLAASPPSPAGSDGWRDIDAEASTYAAEYVMSTEGSDYEPTEHERHLIEDALHGFIAEHWSTPPVAPRG